MHLKTLNQLSWVANSPGAIGIALHTMHALQPISGVLNLVSKSVLPH